MELGTVFAVTQQQFLVPYSRLLKQQNRCSQSSSVRDLLVPATDRTLFSSVTLSKGMLQGRTQIDMLPLSKPRIGRVLGTSAASGMLAKNFLGFLFSILHI